MFGGEGIGAFVVAFAANEVEFGHGGELGGAEKTVDFRGVAESHGQLDQ